MTPNKITPNKVKLTEAADMEGKKQSCVSKAKLDGPTSGAPNTRLGQDARMWSYAGNKDLGLLNSHAVFTAQGWSRERLTACRLWTVLLPSILSIN